MKNNTARKVKPITHREQQILEDLLRGFCDYCNEGKRVLWDDEHKTYYHPDVYSGTPCAIASNRVRMAARKFFGNQVARKLLGSKSTATDYAYAFDRGRQRQ